MKYLPILLILLSCSEPISFSIQPELKPYYDSFMAAAADQGFTSFDHPGNLIMVIRDSVRRDYQAIGVTRKLSHKNFAGPNSDEQHFIYIDRYFFDHHTKWVETVVWHELGHCYLDRDHNPYISLMNPQYACWGWPSKPTFQDQQYIDLIHNTLVKELFYNFGK